MAKQKKLKKTWRKLRHATDHRLAICRGKEVTILSKQSFDWWVGDRPAPHISHLIRKSPAYDDIDLHAPDTIVGVYVEGPIRKGQKKSGRAFIDLCNDTAWSLVNEKGKILLHEEIQLKALHPGVIEPITRSANHKLRELV